ncbi:MAG: hypothetical protein ACI9QQ_000052 [Myxococcota bacterium]|jgi:hypothetical protein
MAQISRSLQQACLARFQNIVPVLTLIFGGSQTIRASLNQSDAAIQSFDLFPLVLTCHSKKVLVNTVRRCSLELLSIGALGQSRALRIASEECMGWVRFDPEVVVFLSFFRSLRGLRLVVLPVRLSRLRASASRFAPGVGACSPLRSPVSTKPFNLSGDEKDAKFPWRPRERAESSVPNLKLKSLPATTRLRPPQATGGTSHPRLCFLRPWRECVNKKKHKM